MSEDEPRTDGSSPSSRAGLATDALRAGQLSLTIRLSNGDDIDIDPHFVRPFGADLLLEPAQGRDPGLMVEMQSLGMTLNGTRHEELYDLRTRVQFTEALTVFSLVRGGWTPMPFTMPPRFLVDRNVVSQLRRIREGRNTPNSQALQWWTRLFEGGSATFNPLPYALEGAFRRAPSRNEFMQAYEEGVAELVQAFPRCQTIRYSPPIFDAAYSLIVDFDRRAARETAFLIEVSPMITQRPSEARLWSTAQEVLQLADRHQIPRHSLPPIAALSCVFEDAHGTVRSIGRALLKPRDNYAEEDAFNALSDIRHVEITATGQALFGPESFAFCTCDRGLARFWSALGLRGERTQREAIEWEFDLSTEIFSRLTEPDIPRLQSEISL